MARLDAIADDDRGRYLRTSASDNTWRAYRSDLADYDRWCRQDRRRSWSSASTIATYLRFLADAGASYATIERRKSAIAKLVAAEAALSDEIGEDPTKHQRVTLALKAIRKSLGTDQDRAEPLTGERLLQVLLAIDADTLAGQRDIALLLTGFYGALRVSELAAITPNRLTFEREGVAIALHDTKGLDHTVWVPVHRQSRSRWDPVAALEVWVETLTNSDLDERPESTPAGDIAAPFLDPEAGIWRRITRGDNFYRPSRSISVDAIDDIVARRVMTAGLPKPRGYSPHSLRAGFVTEAKNRGIDEADIMRHTRHKSLEVMRGYDRTAGWWQRNATTGMSL